MALPYRKWINSALILGGLGIVVNLYAAILPKWFANNIHLVNASGILIIVLLVLVNLPEYLHRRRMNSDKMPRSFFCGRKEEREILISLLRDEQKSIVNIYGLGGVGKTSLVREVVEENKIFKSIVWQTARKQFMEQGAVRHSELSESATFDSLCNRIASYFGVLIEYQALKKAHERMHFVENLLKDRPTLLIIDSFETIDEDFNSFLQSLTDVIAGTSSKAILTCRFRLDKVESHKLDGLTLEETAELLNHDLTVEGKKINLSKQKVLEVHRATNGLPLALKLIAARVRATHVAALDDILGRLSAIDFGDTPEVYERFYKFIYHEIYYKSLSKDAQELLIKLSTFSSDERITYKSLQTHFFDNEANPSNKEKDRFERAFSQNIKFALLESREIDREDGFFIHPLTKTFVRAELVGKTK
jgi:hypothetical protein